METVTGVAISPAMFVPWYKRLLNFVIDILVVCLIFIILGAIAGILSLFGYNGFALWFDKLDGLTDRLVTTLVMVIYLFVIEVFTQRSVGKFITGTIVVSEDGTKPEARSIMIRNLCRIISFEALTFLGSTPRGWHDSASGTYVVDAKKYKEALESRQSFDLIGLEQN